MDTLVTNTLLLTMDPDRSGDGGDLGIIDDGAVGWNDGELAYVGAASDVDEARAADVVDADGCATLPGFVNAHSHMSHTIVRGAAQDVPEIEWMNRALGPIANHVTPADEVVGTRLGAIETLLSGVTTVCEYASDVGRLIEKVYEPLGLRTVATETINEVPDDRAALGPRELYPLDKDQGDAALERAEHLFAAYADDDLVTPMYGPQALDMVSLDLLHEIVERAEEHGRGIHMHVAQGEREAIQVAERYGTDASTVSVLDDEGALSDRLVAAHLHGATPAERERLAEAGVSMVGCPSSIVAIDGIVPPMAEFREYGGVVGVGTDQAPGPGGHDVLRELRTAAMVGKADRSDPTTLPAWETLQLATVGGARALGIADEVGTLTEGKRADVTVIDLDSPGLAPTVAEPFHTAVPNLVYASTGSAVREVFVDGDGLVRDGDVAGIDVDAVVADAKDRAERVFADAEADWRAADSTLVDAVDEGRL